MTDPRDHRLERFLSLGFDLDAANALAEARTETTVKDRAGIPRVWRAPLHWARVARALEAGCTHAEALAIFT